jgi:hypothetical protein
MVAQLRHLLNLSRRPDTTIRLIPRGARFYEARANPFDLLKFPEVNDRLTMVHSILGTHFAPTDLTDTWTHIEQSETLSPDDSRALIRQLISDTTRG